MEKTFARRHRLTRTDEFSSVFGFRRAIRGRLLTLHYQPRPDGETEARIGVVVGKKALRRAVDRNKLKRIIREHFRSLRADLPVVDLVARLAVKSTRLDGKILADDFVTLLERLPQRRSKTEE
ncbi:MAG: ribonuclease P protein component [Dechloromonas sp.]|nr:ribonuclease P protein component [Dechloromonas sp.]